MHMRVLGAHDEEIDPHVDWSSDRSPNFTVRQDSGTWNALGNLKIDMPNPYSVYMHDTDARRLFADDYRFDSHGCTRVDNVRDLAAWILDDVPGWNRAAIDAGIATGEPRIVNLPRKMPVAWVYITGWMTRDGTIEFRQIFTTNLYKWMRVYDYLDAQEHAEMWMEDLSDEESEASVYRKVDTEMPACIKAHAKTLKYRRAKNIFQEIRPHTGVAREMIRHLLEMDVHGQGQEHAWPGQLNEKDVPGIDDWLMDAENSRPGCLITWYENDAINACFDEEAQHMGENGPCQPNVALPIHLNKPAKELDEEVRRVFDHASAMLRSLASAARIVELVRDLYDEYLREHRIESGLPVEPSPAGIREE